MKIWINRNKDVVIKIVGGYSLIYYRDLPVVNKRFRIKMLDVISFASKLDRSFPPGFPAQYYSENVKYWHELRKWIKEVCD